METLRDNELITELTKRPKMQITRDMTLCWKDFRIVHFTERHRSRLDGTKNSAHATTQLQKKTIHTLAAAAERKRRDSQWKNGPMNQCEDYAEAIKVKERLHKESGEGNATIHSSKQERQRENQPFSWSREGAERIDPKTGWTWYHSTASSCSSSSWWQSSDKWWHASSWNEQWFSMAIPLQATNKWTPHQSHAHVALPHTWFFLLWLKTWVIKSTGDICVSQNSHLHFHHAMSHAQSLLFPLCLTSRTRHSHSKSYTLSVPFT